MKKEHTGDIQLFGNSSISLNHLGTSIEIVRLLEWDHVSYTHRLCPASIPQLLAMNNTQVHVFTHQQQ